MQASRSIFRSFRCASTRRPSFRPFSSIPPSIKRPPPWPKEQTYSLIRGSFRQQTAARPFSTASVFRNEASASTEKAAQTAREDVPSYEMRFTCKRCMTPQTHKISKQAYHSGTVLVTCRGCKNRHLVADHLKIFSDKSVTLEDILKENGQSLKKGTLSADGDLEFWDDGTTTTREASTPSNEPSR